MLSRWYKKRLSFIVVLAIISMMLHPGLASAAAYHYFTVWHNDGVTELADPHQGGYYYYNTGIQKLKLGLDLDDIFGGSVSGAAYSVYYNFQELGGAGQQAIYDPALKLYVNNSYTIPASITTVGSIPVAVSVYSEPGHTLVPTEIGFLAVMNMSPLTMGLGLGGATTNLASVSDFTYVKNLTFEYNQSGVQNRIKFMEPVNLADDDSIEFIENLSGVLRIAYKGSAGLNFSSLGGIPWTLQNKEAEITMYNLPFQSAPSVARIPDGQSSGPLVVRGDEILDSTVVNSVNYVGNAITLNINGFSRYLTCPYLLADQEDQTVGSSSLTVTGTTDATATITVSGATYGDIIYGSTDPNGRKSFQAPLTLVEGENNITIIATTNSAGLIYNSGTKRTFSYVRDGGGSGDSNSVPVPVADSVVSLVSTAGGTVSIPDGRVSVIIPAGGITGEGNLSISEQAGSAAPPPGGCVSGSSVFNISLQGSGMVKPATIVFKYQPDKFTGISTDKIGLYYFNQNRKAWVYAGGEVDAAAGKVTVEVSHPGMFAVMANPGLPSLSDIQTHWANRDIRRLIGLMAVNGYPDGTFRPESSITRAEFATILARAMGWQENSAAAGFSDKIPEWAKGYIGAAVEKGVIRGYEDNTFRASQLISRAEMAVMAVRALGRNASSRQLEFRDTSSIPHWAAGLVATAVEEGIVSGFPDKTFKPAEDTNRAQSSALFVRLMDKLNI